MRSTILGCYTTNCWNYTQNPRFSLVPQHMHGKGAGSLSWQPCHVWCRKLGRQSQQSLSTDRTASSTLQFNPQAFPLSLIFSPTSKYIILMVLTYPKRVLKWPLQLPEWPCLPACAKEDHKLSRWVHLSVTKMKCGLATIQHATKYSKTDLNNLL
jgi:hypothetical protein